MFEFFKAMYAEVKRQFLYLQKHGREDKNAKQYTWEKVIELLGKDIWEEWNQFYG